MPWRLSRKKNKDHVNGNNEHNLLPVCFKRKIAAMPLGIQNLAETNKQMTRLDLKKSLKAAASAGIADIEDILRATKNSAATIKDIYLGPYFYAGLTDASRSFFVRGLGRHFRHLRSLSIGTLEHTRASFKGEDIGHLIADAHEIHTLRVERDITFSTQEETKYFAKCLVQHPSLRRITLLSLYPITDDAAASIDCIFHALSSLSRLESLQLGISDGCSALTSVTVTPNDVASLAKNCHHLSWLYMSRFPLRDEHMIALFAMIAEQGAHREAGAGGSSLKVLDFPQSWKLTVKSWEALWTLLQSNAALECVSMFAPLSAKTTKACVLAFLALNRDGKRHQVRNCKDLDSWIQIVHRFTDRELSVLYMVVRENPFICSL